MNKDASGPGSADSRQGSFSMAQFLASLKDVCVPLSSLAEVTALTGPPAELKTLIDEPGNRLTVSTDGDAFHLTFGGTRYRIEPTRAIPYKYLQVILGSTIFRWLMEQGSQTGAALAAAPIMPVEKAGTDRMVYSLRMADELARAVEEGTPKRIRGTLQHMDEVAATIYGFPENLIPRLQVGW